MKKNLLLLIAAAGILTSANAQIPNAGFENWTSVGSYEIPNAWGTMNNATASYSVFTATKGTPGSPGNSYLKLTSQATGTTITNGIAVSGRLDTLTLLPKSGFAFTQRPSALSGKWQHMIYGNSQGSVKVLTTKWNTATSSRDTIAHVEQTLSGMVMNWANFSLNLAYKDSLNYPDSCIIVLQASGANPAGLDYLWVDNLALTGTVAIATHTTSTVGLKEIQNSKTNLSLFPNPAHESLQLTFMISQAQQVSIEVYDLTGRSVYSVKRETVPGEWKERIDVRDLSKGTYLVKISGKDISETKKIVIE